jgi:hypothetical protein
MSEFHELLLWISQEEQSPEVCDFSRTMPKCVSTVTSEISQGNFPTQPRELNL